MRHVHLLYRQRSTTSGYSGLHCSCRTGYGHGAVKVWPGRAGTVRYLVWGIIECSHTLYCYHGVGRWWTNAECGISIGPRVNYKVRGVRRISSGRHRIQIVAIKAVFGIRARLIL